MERTITLTDAEVEQLNWAVGILSVGQGDREKIFQSIREKLRTPATELGAAPEVRTEAAPYAGLCVP